MRTDRVYLMDLPLKELERLRETMYVTEPLSENVPWWSHDSCLQYLESSGQGPRRASPEGATPSLPSVSAPGVLTDYRGAPCPVTFRRRTYAGVMFVMAACLTAAFLLIHFNHA